MLSIGIIKRIINQVKLQISVGSIGGIGITVGYIIFWISTW
ncbi:MAG: hypothetical protein RBR47_13485 [Bacteroidales bacterium]|nr:hypothetical protein [Bacteroidales bacterium]MDY0335960.1 hypothetical protein [Bacteroidales bacterium]